VILIDAHPRHDWLVKAVERRLREELAKLQVEINEDKSRMVDWQREKVFHSWVLNIVAFGAVTECGDRTMRRS
jgi:hypothetical protein